VVYADDNILCKNINTLKNKEAFLEVSKEVGVKGNR
jgi:hypothetical protein